MKLIERSDYLNRLLKVKGTSDIKIITGVRRCGKSKLLEAFIGHLKAQEKDANIIHINFNLLQFEDLLEYHQLAGFIESKHVPEKVNYVLIDEVQMCSGFEKAINSLHASENYDIYLTGSNAFLLSSNLATLFTGRTFEIEVYPFSFSEFISYYGYSCDSDTLEKYISEGGMAGSYQYASLEEKYRYINDDVFNALIVRDIISKHRIRNKVLLERLVDFLMDNIGNITSLRSISKSLSNGNKKTNDKTIGTYIGYLCKAFAFYRIRRYDIKGKKYLSSDDKYYLSDHSFRYAKLGTKNLDYGRVLENIVAMELLRRGYEVYAGALYKTEIDFVAIRQNEKTYFQVCDDISRKETFEREVTPLLNVKDAYPKIILARTNHNAYQYEGVKIIDLARWLSDNAISRN